MKYLSYPDCAIILAYFVILICIGRYLKKRASASLSDYFLGGRCIPWWLLGISGMAAWVDMTGTMIITSFLFMLGPRGLFVEFRGGAGLVLIFLLLWLGKWHRRSGCLTLAEWMTFRFGEGFGGKFAKIASAVSTIIFTIGLLSYSFVGAGLFLSMFLPYPPWVCSLILLIVTLFYTLEAGFYGVVIADVFQMAIIICVTIFVAIITIIKIHACPSLASIAVEVTGNTDWMNSLPNWHTNMPKGYESYSALTAVTIFYLAKTMIQGVGIGGDPKYFGARNDRECGLLSFLCGSLMSIRWFLMMGFVILGLFLIKDLFADQAVLAQAAILIKQHLGNLEQNQWAQTLSDIMNHTDKFSPALINGLQNLLGPDWAKKLSLLSFHGTVDSERILPAVMLFYIPTGIRGLFLVGLLAAAMSTFNAFINMTTGFFTNDIYKSCFRRAASNRELIYVSYIFGVVIVAISFIMAYSSKNINDIWSWLMMGLSGGLIAPLALRFYWWRFNGVGFAVSTCCGVIAAILQRWFLPNMPEWQQFIFITSLSFTAAIIGTYCGKPTDHKVLEEFYRKTRPFGFWRPFANLFNPRQLAVIKREHFYDIVALPFTFLWQVTILLAPMLLIIGAYRSFYITLGLLAVSLTGMYFFWYKHLPAENYESCDLHYREIAVEINQIEAK